jgi:hypothetical protein
VLKLTPLFVLACILSFQASELAGADLRVAKALNVSGQEITELTDLG